MWRFLLISLGLTMTSISVYPQKFTVGVKAGFNINWAGFGDKPEKDTFSTGTINGYIVGAQIGFPLKKEYQLMVEGGYGEKGRAIKYHTSGDWLNKSTYRVIEGNMLLRKSYKFHIAKNVPSTWFFEIGPEINYVISGSGAVNFDGGNPVLYKIAYNKTPDGSFNTLYYTNANRFLFGLVLGVGFKAPLKNNHHIATQLRFTSGHTFIGKRRSQAVMNLWDFYDTPYTNLKTLSLTVAYSLDFDVQQSRKGKSTLDKQNKRR